MSSADAFERRALSCANISSPDNNTRTTPEMGENDDKTPPSDLEAPTPRQLQAEAQVARLEREVQDLRSRLKGRPSTPLGGRSAKSEDWESKNFQLEEQVGFRCFLRFYAFSFGEPSNLELQQRRIDPEIFADLKFQLASKQNEISKVQDTLNKRIADSDKMKSDYEDKLKKMRGIFAQASKSLDEYRASISAKDAELESLRTELAESKAQEEVKKSALDESQSMFSRSPFARILSLEAVERLTSDLSAQAAMYTSQVNQLDSKLRQTNTQLMQTKTEYQQYKQRANALLQQKSQESAGIEERKIAELEALVKRLELEKSEAITNLRSTQQRLALVEQDLHQSFDQIAGLERELERAQRAEKQNAELRARMDELIAKATQDKKDGEEALFAQEQRHATTLQTLRQEIQRSSRDVEDRLTKKEEECEELQRISERLSDDLSTLRADLARRNAEMEELRLSLRPRSITPAEMSTDGHGSPTSVATFPLSDRDGTAVGDGSISGEAAGKWGTIYASLSDLLSGSGSGGQDDQSSSSTLNAEKEKEYMMKLRHLAELLNESEANVVRLTQQEKVLKEEIRKLDTFDKRQNLSIEYLKNVVLKFIQSGDKEREVGASVISVWRSCLSRGAGVLRMLAYMLLVRHERSISLIMLRSVVRHVMCPTAPRSGAF
ncbi:LOW QUALITY PROTEIN: hypothetical protein BC938DRAFT_483086 [Jimgerdemannia flammicorona]|uniref:GRIP domain-containing protein n=1 Tax=Jimgerdemannia flammicorona TaxID=994334 RepID=A0A433QCT6_9FUNG|nr:LOW QUALITY PROTEIN: hypothetical protein BC938DRAFT_483086 [Jimgerdemannia flammicorona]